MDRALGPDVENCEIDDGPTTGLRRARSAHRAQLRRARPDRRRFDACQRGDGREARELSAARISRRPRARPRRRRHALSRRFPTPTRASCRAVSPNSCARRAAPRSRSNGARKPSCRPATAKSTPPPSTRRSSATFANRLSARSSSTPATSPQRRSSPAPSAAHARAAPRPARPEDGAAGMGASAWASAAALSRDGAVRSRSRAGIHRLGRTSGLCAGRSERSGQAACRAGRGERLHRARKDIDPVARKAWRERGDA